MTSTRQRSLPPVVRLLALLPWTIRAQFGNLPPPICKAFGCPKGQRPVGRDDVDIVSYGCKEAGLNVLSMKDLGNPYGNMNQIGKNLNKCCIERDVCKQTCGMTSKECHEAYQKCQQKVCKGDSNCQLQAMVADFSNDPYDEGYRAADKESYDPAESKCRGYNKAQEAVCHCVPEAEVKPANEKKLKAFYKKFNPEKLDKKGNIKDLDDVWKKWKGKEPSMFMALATKYKDKAVKIKEKPKPPPYEPPREAEDSPAPPAKEAAVDADSDPEGAAFDAELKELLEKKEAAKTEEDFDKAQDLKEKADELKVKEVARLKARKDEALKEEKYLEAKAIKLRIEKLEL